MPECTSTGCRRERFAFVAFFSQSALYDGCVVFFVHVLPCLRLRGAIFWPGQPPFYARGARLSVQDALVSALNRSVRFN